ncbi:glycosyltransferase family 4 protein [Uliginosibacterium sp. H1]|uniref:glycosyltransferase family 4 protein n=1 Tax=Uliginosibacterium sp. H1 TaxID=3114757 RepID=UPI002E182DF1|nr:glycosyltransferase family 4 protein [Uliginosibacterium sp. H1]
MMRIVLFANTDWYLYNFRLALADALKAAGHEVVLLSPQGEWGERLRAAGHDWRVFPFARHGLNPLAELAVLWRLWRLYRALQPDVVHHFTIKCVLYGTVAARCAGVRKVVNAITGLGHVMMSSSWKARLLRPIILTVYRVLFAGCDIVFQNRDNLALFQKLGVLRRARAHLVPGSGVNLARFDMAPPPADQPPVVLMVARLLWAKGIATFVEAAASVRRQRAEIEFWLVGDRDDSNPDCIPQAQVERWASEGAVRFLGHREDIPQLNARASLAALPSHGEGLPRTLIEAAASARPLLASDVPGCRDIVRHGENGLLFPRGDAAAFAASVLRLVDDPVTARRMGLAARADAERYYDDAHNIAQTLAVYAAPASAPA